VSSSFYQVVTLPGGLWIQGTLRSSLHLGNGERGSTLPRVRRLASSRVSPADGTLTQA
jgi:hypothetical protein